MILDDLAREMVGDCEKPDLFFVREEGTVFLVTDRFAVAYEVWKNLPRTMETSLENRCFGVICSNVQSAEGKYYWIDDSCVYKRYNGCVSKGNL